MKVPQDRSGTSRERRRRQVVRRGVVVVSALVGGTLLATACAGRDGTAAGPARPGPVAHVADAAAHRDASAAHITITPKDRSTGVGVDHDTKVSVTGGTLTSVTLAKAGGKAARHTTVPGRISADGRSWQPQHPLEKSTRYTVSANARDAHGRPAAAHAGFSTVSPTHSLTAYPTPANGSTVGVGMPVSVDFDKAVTHKAAVQSHMTVTATGGQRVVGHWFGGKRIDFRPRDYWKPGTDVTVKLRLDHVKAAAGVTGVQDTTTRFHVGRSQVSTVDVATQTMTVVRDGQTVNTLPVSSGSPDHPTYNGRMVVTEKFDKTRMNGSTVGFGGEYDIPDVPHAMRLSNSGTFIHGNYWSPGSVFGASPTSHGCIGLRDLRGAGDPTTDAAWFYDHSLTGDVVVVQHSQGRTVAADNGLNGWNMSWSRWIAGSATG